MPLDDAAVARISRPRRTRVAITMVFAVAAGAYVAVRGGASTPFPTFVGACQRLKASGLQMSPKDWFCNPIPWTQHASYLAATFLVWLGYVVPCAILASTGRRFTALLPVAVAPFFTFAGFDIFQVRWWGPSYEPSYWPTHSGPSVALNLGLLIAPVAAVSVASRGRRPRAGADPRMASVFVSAALLAVPTLGVTMLALAMFSRHFAPIGGSVSWNALAPAVMSIAAFGGLLGPNRRWWPWSIAPVAVLLSLGPAGAILPGPEHLQIWTQFGAAVPLAVVGVLWAGWWPLSVALTGKLRRTRPVSAEEKTLAVPLGIQEETTPARDVSPIRRRAVQPGVVFNSLAVSLLAVSVIMFRADPLPVQLGSELPTYLGARVQWQDVRARLDLRQAISVADSYAAAHGSPLGFTAAKGAAADHSLAWADLAALPKGVPAPTLTMVVSVSKRRTRIGVLSASGAGFCIGRTGRQGALTYGSVPELLGQSPPSTLGRAFADCGRAPWTPQLLTALPIGGFCNGMDVSSAYLMCRMVQVLGAKIMTTTKLA